MNLPSHFALNRADYDAIVKVEIQGAERESILESLWFDLPDHQLWGLLPENNIETLSRIILIKRLKDEDRSVAK